MCCLFFFPILDTKKKQKIKNKGPVIQVCQGKLACEPSQISQCRLAWLGKLSNVWPFLFFFLFFKLMLFLYFFFQFFLFIVKLILILSFILFKEPLLIGDYFFGYAFNFLRGFSDSSIIYFYFFYRWTLFLKIKKLFLDNIFNMCSLTWYFFFFFIIFNQFMCVCVSIIVWLNKKIILIKHLVNTTW